MTISRGSISKELIPGLNAVFGTSYKSIDNEHLALFDVEKSNRSFEEEVMLTGFGHAPEKFEGTTVFYDDMKETYKVTYNHVTIALGFAITEEAVEDNLYPELSRNKAKALGRAMASTKQVRAADIFNNAFAATQLGGDGSVMLGNAHPTLTGNQSNILATAAQLSETALEQAVIDIGNFRDERGILIDAKPKSLHIPLAYVFTAHKILKSPMSTFPQTITAAGLEGASSAVVGVGTQNRVNALNQMGYFSNGVNVNHRFTNTLAWFIKTDVPNGLKHFVRVPLETGDEGDFDTGNYRYKARERYSFYWSDWRSIYGTPGS